MADVNKIIIQGTIIRKIIREFANSKIAILQVMTDGGSQVSAMINVTFFDTRLVQVYDVDYRVRIIAHVQLDKKQIGGKAQYYQAIVGTSIMETKRLICQHLSPLLIGDIDEYDGGMPVDVNDAIFVGKIVNVYSPNDKTTCLTILMHRGRRLNRAKIYCFKRQNELAATLSVHDRVAAICSIRTDNERSYYMPYHEIFYCKDLALLKD